MKVWDMGYAAVGWDLGWEWDCWTGAAADAGVGWARALLFFILNHILTQNGIVVKIFCIACRRRAAGKMASARSGQLTGTAKGMAGGRAHTSQKKFFLLDF
jgi:hypothetical protein